MVKIFYIVLFLCVFLNQNVKSQTPRFPFPQHFEYAEDAIIPTNYTQDELDEHLAYFYKQWKSKYLKSGCEANQYYVGFDLEGISVSEGHGWGMMITALMAGHDPDSKKYFDGLYDFYKANPSRINPYLMDWKQVTCNDKPSKDDDSAADGDIDIAYALLLAHAQWGADTYKYINAARNIINAILEDDINPEIWTVKFGDWASADSPNTRSSDFITDHFRTFICGGKNQDWENVVDACYNIIDSIQSNYSTETGLMPDFIIDSYTSPKPAGEYLLESEYDGHYYYNACRFPMRIGTDFVVSGDPRAKKALSKINTWLREKCDNNPDNIVNGYLLNGTELQTWSDPTFVAPFAVGAMADADQQEWLNSLYERVLNAPLNGNGYYENTIKMISMFVLTGNYWTPPCEIISSLGENFPSDNRIKIQYSHEMSMLKVSNFNPEVYKTSNLIVCDMYGRILFKNRINNNEQTFDMSSLARGVYIANIETSGQNSGVSYKFVR